jgi:uncharacterized damage-inducible protein DinB
MAMDAGGLQALARFNTWGNENLRQSMLAADEQTLRQDQPGYWFGSVFFLLTHILGGETSWLARLGGVSSVPQPNPDDFSPETLAEAWRAKDREWEEWSARATPEQLAQRGTWRRANGKLYELEHWQVATHVMVHSANHRAHVTVAMTELGIEHGPLDFLDQFSPLPGQ